MSREQICEWTRNWFHLHPRCSREDFDLPQMRQDVKRPEVVRVLELDSDGRGYFRYYKPSDTDPLLDLLLGGTK